MKTLIKKLLKMGMSKKTLSSFYTLKSFTHFQTERIPSVDNILVFLFYRFCYFKNYFLKVPSISFESITKSEIIDFDFTKEQLSRFENDGITPVFKLKNSALLKIKDALSEQSVSVDGKNIKCTIENFSALDGKEFNGLYHYKNLNKNSKLIEVATDPAIIQFVSAYLRSDSFTLDMTAFWSFPNKTPVEAGGYDNAQKYHFDHVGKRCVKLFCYLSNCEIENGPHCYVKGSHRKKPFILQLKDGRFTNEELEKYYPKDDKWLALTGNEGSCFIADPYGFHKGQEPVKDSRLLIQFMFSVDYYRKINYEVNLNASEILTEYQLKG